ncbi:MAG: hypothetical protein ACFE9S_06640 [Candidatus Hermodarchaeota archaeon]
MPKLRRENPIRINRNLTMYQVIWFIEDTIALIISVYLLRYIKKHNLIEKWYNLKDQNLT